MNRFEFDKLDKFEQVNYINSELKKSGLTLTKICNKLEIGRSTIRDRFKKIGYFYDKKSNLYLMDHNELMFCNDNENNNMYNISNVNVESENNSSNTNVISFEDAEFRENIISLARDYNDIKQMLEDYKQNKMVVSKQIIIDYLNRVEDSETKLTTLRVNKYVLEKFNIFVENNKQFTKVDLFSQALINFVEQYKEE